MKGKYSRSFSTQNKLAVNYLLLFGSYDSEGCSVKYKQPYHHKGQPSSLNSNCKLSGTLRLRAEVEAEFLLNVAGTVRVYTSVYVPLKEVAFVSALRGCNLL